MSRGVAAGPARALLVIALLGLLAGCESLSYYAQSVKGHLSLMAARTDIEKLLADRQTPDRLREQLALVLGIREFASRELALPDNGSYRSYVDVGEPYVVWNVIAAPEFSLTPQTSCFLVVGCLAYRGYFDAERAVGYGERLRVQGFDVHVGGVRAYSTLGWFDDPMLNTMLSPLEADIAAIVFHELAHQRLYIDDDTAFNEAFAVAVEREGVRRWLEERKDRAALEGYERRQSANRAFTELLLEGRIELGKLYRSGLSSEQMRARKRSIVERLKNRFERSGLGDEYAGWFEPNMNNAKLALVATYWETVPAFTRMLEASEGDLAAFYQAVESLSRLPRAARDEYLRSLLPQPQSAKSTSSPFSSSGG